MLIGLLIVIVVLVLLFISLYNRLVSLRVRSQNAWSDIDVQLKRRADLVPNLVETVKGYAAHERGTLDAVTQARTKAVAAQSAGPAERAKAENELTTALRGLAITVEAYPQLQAASNFRELQQQLAIIETPSRTLGATTTPSRATSTPCLDDTVQPAPGRGLSRARVLRGRGRRARAAESQLLNETRFPNRG